MQISAGVNGFGRFGLHLLKFYLDHYTNSPFRIQSINDDFLGIKKAFSIITNDDYVDFSKYTPSISEHQIVFNLNDGETVKINYTNQAAEEIEWIGKYQLHLECSGKLTDADKAKSIFLKGETQKVLISATSWNADRTLVYGFNHEDYTPDMTAVSYGSCTVNAYVPLANFIEKEFGIVTSDVNVIHNMPGYWLKDEKHYTLVRRFCTLEKSGPNLLPFINKDNFRVNYTLIPYDGVSMIDFRFRIKTNTDTEQAINKLKTAMSEGALKGLYNMEAIDRGPNAHICTPYSSVFIEDQVKVLGDELYLMAYFDNENSVNRYFDLVKFVANKLQ